MNALLATIILVLAAAPHGELHERIKEMDAKIKEAPNSVDLLLKRGELHRLHEEFPKALRDIQKARELDPKRVEINLLKGRLLIDMKKHDAAAKCFRLFLADRPGHPLGLRYSALNERTRNQHATASKFLVTLVNRRGHATPQDILNCCDSLSRGFKDGDARALKLLGEQLKQRGSVITLELEALKFEKKTARFDAALKRVERLAKGQRRQDTWTVRRAEIYELMNKGDLAKKEYEKALREIARLPRAVQGRPAVVKHRKSIEERLTRQTVSTEK